MKYINLNKNVNLIQKVSLILLVFTILLYICPKSTNAQAAISLSITPPLFEATIQPGKEVKQIYTISNNGGDTLITPKIVYMEPEGLNGNVNLTENEAPDWVRYDKEPFNLSFQSDKQFTVLISPPEGVEEIDHFLTLIFESTTPTDVLGQNATFYKSTIGTNILLTISKDGNPKKSAEIVKFDGPNLIDYHFGKIKYDLVLKNNGNSFWKPIGKIIFNDSESLKLAELNVLSGNSRKISCIQNESLTECEINKNFKLGKNKSNIEFTIDEDPKVYKQELITYIFPFSYLGIILIFLTLIKIGWIFKIWQRKK